MKKERSIPSIDNQKKIIIYKINVYINDNLYLKYYKHYIKILVIYVFLRYHKINKNGFKKLFYVFQNTKSACVLLERNSLKLS